MSFVSGPRLFLRSAPSHARRPVTGHRITYYNYIYSFYFILFLFLFFILILILLLILIIIVIKDDRGNPRRRSMARRYRGRTPLH